MSDCPPGCRVNLNIFWRSTLFHLFGKTLLYHILHEGDIVVTSWFRSILVARSFFVRRVMKWSWMLPTAFSQFNLARQFFDWWPLFRHPKQRPFDLTSARRSSMLFLLSSPHLWGGWLLPQKTHKLCCFGSCFALGLPLLSLGRVREENNAKLLAPWLLFTWLLSGALFLLLFNTSGEKTGSFARSASLTNSSRLWKDTVLSFSSGHHVLGNTTWAWLEG